MAALKTEVALIVSSLAKAVVAEILTAAGKVSVSKRTPEAEQKLEVLVDGLCLEAVEKILKVFEQQEEEDGGRRDEDGEASTQREGDSESSSVLTLRGGGCSPPAEDHEYARQPAPPPGGSAADGGVRKHPGIQRRKEAATATIQRRKEAVPATTDTPLQCSQCDMMFPNGERLSDHTSRCHPACSVCGATFSGILKLRDHESRVHGLLPYACDYCPKRFNHKTHRDLHVKARHTGEKTCHCDVCGKGYSCVSVLKAHRMTHFDKSFICDVCGKAFFHACHLTRHKLLHQEERPHRCSVCGRGFTQAANLRSHQLTHSGERQLCSVCGKSVRCLKNHVVSRHAHELPADQLPPPASISSCHVCGKKFPTPSQCRLHQRSHSGEKPFHCDVCGKSYRLKELLRDHRYTHSGERPYRCPLCSRTFSLATSFIRHRSIHTGDTPHSCKHCGKSFRLLTFLKAHLQTKAHLKKVQQRPLTSDL